VDRVRRAARAVSDVFSGVVGIAVFLGLAFLGVIGTVLTAGDLLHLTIDPALLLFPAAIVVAGNVMYREVQQRRQAEQERDAARAALGAKPDEAATVRMFLALHDEWPRVLEPFKEVIERLPTSMPVGEQRYADWIRRCAVAIETYRPAFALRFRQAQIWYPSDHGLGTYVIVKDDAGADQWVNMDTVRKHEELIGQALGVLTEIINAGR
jgi:hypothetical protein